MISDPFISDEDILESPERAVPIFNIDEMEMFEHQCDFVKAAMSYFAPDRTKMAQKTIKLPHDYDNIFWLTGDVVRARCKTVENANESIRYSTDIKKRIQDIGLYAHIYRDVLPRYKIGRDVMVGCKGTRLKWPNRRMVEQCLLALNVCYMTNKLGRPLTDAENEECKKQVYWEVLRSRTIVMSYLMTFIVHCNVHPTTVRLRLDALKAFCESFVKENTAGGNIQKIKPILDIIGYFKQNVEPLVRPFFQSMEKKQTKLQLTSQRNARASGTMNKSITLAEMMAPWQCTRLKKYLRRICKRMRKIAAAKHPEMVTRSEHIFVTRYLTLVTATKNAQRPGSVMKMTEDEWAKR